MAFKKEEIDWLLEQLKKAADLESSPDFNRKFKEKSGTHLLEVCFNSIGRFIKLLKFATNQ